MCLLGTSGCAEGGSPKQADTGPARDVAPADTDSSDTLDPPDPDPDPNCASACPVVGTCLDGPTAFPPAGQDSWQCLDKAGGCGDGQCKVWCPHDNTVPGPQYTEACYLNDSERSMTYENACKSCCEGLGAAWDSAGHYCKPP